MLTDLPKKDLKYLKEFLIFKTILQALLKPIAKPRLGAPMEYQLMNFNIPTHLKRNLDLIATYKHVSRTSILNRLLDLYCKQELKNLEDSRRIQELIKNHSQPVKAPNPFQELEQPVRMLFDDEYEWEERLKI